MLKCGPCSLRAIAASKRREPSSEVSWSLSLARSEAFPHSAARFFNLPPSRSVRLDPHAHSLAPQISTTTKKWTSKEIRSSRPSISKFSRSTGTARSRSLPPEESTPSLLPTPTRESRSQRRRTRGLGGWLTVAFCPSCFCESWRSRAARRLTRTPPACPSPARPPADSSFLFPPPFSTYFLQVSVAQLLPASPHR